MEFYTESMLVNTSMILRFVFYVMMKGSAFTCEDALNVQTVPAKSSMRAIFRLNSVAGYACMHRSESIVDSADVEFLVNTDEGKVDVKSAVVHPSANTVDDAVNVVNVVVPQSANMAGSVASVVNVVVRAFASTTDFEASVSSVVVLQYVIMVDVKASVTPVVDRVFASTRASVGIALNANLQLKEYLNSIFKFLEPIATIFSPETGCVSYKIFI
jgi:hypothetical protein